MQRLPEGWIQRIFATMQGHYGTRFLNMWKTGQVLPDGTDAGVVNAMNHWSEKMGGTSAATELRTLARLELHAVPGADDPTGRSIDHAAGQHAGHR